MSANKQNLVSFKTLTTEQQRKIASMGGKKSVEVKRRKKNMREALEILLSMKDEDGVDNQTKVLIAMYEKSLKGDVNAANFIRDTVGDKPVDKMEVSKTTNEVANEIEEYISRPVNK